MDIKTRTFCPTINNHGYCPSMVESEFVKDGNKIVSKRKIARFFIDYPLNAEVSFRRRSKNGWTRQKLVSTIKSIYKNNIYKHPDKYGVWGHDIRDLVIERIRVRDAALIKGTIIVTMDIGS